MARQEPYATVVDEATFAIVTRLEMRMAPRLQYPVSMLAILAEPDGVASIPVSRRLAEELARAIGCVIRETDVIRLAVTEPPLYVLLVDADLGDLPGIIERIIAEVRRHHRALRLSVGGSCFPTTALTPGDLMAEAGFLAARAHREQAVESSYRLPATGR